MFLQLLLAAMTLLPSMERPVTPIHLHPESPRSFLFRDKPNLLITSAEHYSAVLNADVQCKPYPGHALKANEMVRWGVPEGATARVLMEVGRAVVLFLKGGMQARLKSPTPPPAGVKADASASIMHPRRSEFLRKQKIAREVMQIIEEDKEGEISPQKREKARKKAAPYLQLPSYSIMNPSYKADATKAKPADRPDPKLLLPSPEPLYKESLSLPANAFNSVISLLSLPYSAAHAAYLKVAAGRNMPPTLNDAIVFYNFYGIPSYLTGKKPSDFSLTLTTPTKRDLEHRKALAQRPFGEVLDYYQQYGERAYYPEGMQKWEEAVRAFTP